MGTTCRAWLVGPDAELATTEARDTVARLEARWSRFVRSSDVCRLNAARGHPRAGRPRDDRHRRRRHRLVAGHRRAVRSDRAGRVGGRRLRPGSGHRPWAHPGGGAGTWLPRHPGRPRWPHGAAPEGRGDRPRGHRQGPSSRPRGRPAPRSSPVDWSTWAATSGSGAPHRTAGWGGPSPSRTYATARRSPCSGWPRGQWRPRARSDEPGEMGTAPPTT